MNFSDMFLQNIFSNPQRMQGPQSPQNPALMERLRQPIPEQHGDPIRTGSQSAMGAARKSEGGFASKLLKTAAREMENYSIAGLRGSESVPARNLGAMWRTPDEEDAFMAQKEKEKQRKDLEMYQFLSKQAQIQHDMAHKDSMLDEKKRYHNMRASVAGSKGSKQDKNRPETEEIPGMDLSQYPKMKTAKERNEYAATLKGSNMAFRALENIKHDFDKLEDMTKENIASPMGSTVPFSNPTKNIIARMGVNKEITDEVVLRKRLESQFARLEPVLEKGLKGSAAGEQILKRFHDLGVYMNSGQPMNVVKDRLDELLSEVDENRKTAQLSLRSGRHIDQFPKPSVQPQKSNLPLDRDDLMQTRNDIIKKIKQLEGSEQ